MGYFYSTFGESKWRPVGDALFGDANNVIVHPDAGIIIKRKDPSDLPVKILGTVKEGATSLSVVEGFNVISNVSPVNVTLADSGLFTGDATTGVKSAQSPASADEVVLFDPDTQSSVGYFYSTFGEAKWRPAGDALFGDANDVELPAGTAVIINRKSGNGDFAWQVPQRPSDL